MRRTQPKHKDAIGHSATHLLTHTHACSFRYTTELGEFIARAPGVRCVGPQAGQVLIQAVKIACYSSPGPAACHDLLWAPAMRYPSLRFLAARPQPGALAQAGLTPIGPVPQLVPQGPLACARPHEVHDTGPRSLASACDGVLAGSPTEQGSLPVAKGPSGHVVLAVGTPRTSLSLRPPRSS